MEYWQLLRKHLGSQKVIIPCGVGAIVEDGNILLAFHNGANMWHIPGGLQDLGESITDTVERELYEELHLTCRVKELISVFSSPRWDFTISNGDQIQPVEFFFLMERTDSSESIQLQTDEVSSARYFSLHDLPEDMLPCCKQKCADLRTYKGRVFMR